MRMYVRIEDVCSLIQWLQRLLHTYEWCFFLNELQSHDPGWSRRKIFQSATHDITDRANPVSASWRQSCSTQYLQAIGFAVAPGCFLPKELLPMGAQMYYFLPKRFQFFSSVLPTRCWGHKELGGAGTRTADLSWPKGILHAIWHHAKNYKTEGCWAGLVGQLLLRVWLGFSQRVVNNCMSTVCKYMCVCVYICSYPCYIDSLLLFCLSK